MRHVLTFLLLLVLLLSVVRPAAADDYRTAVFTIGGSTATVNGRPLATDPAPFTDDGVTFVPVRCLAAALGAQLAWDQGSRTVTLTAPGTVVVLTVDSPVASVDGQAVDMGVAPRIIPPGRAVLPPRRVAEAFGYTVHWLPELKWVLITNHPPFVFPPASASPTENQGEKSPRSRGLAFP